MELLTGPPGSAKTHLVLKQMRRGLAAGRCRTRLVVPTATMAEHLRHVLAREGYAFRPSLVTTLAQFTAEQAGVLPAASAPVLDWLVTRALEDLDLREYRRVAGFPGFRLALARVLKEISLAGLTADRLSSWREAQSLAAVYAHVQQGALERGTALAGECLAAAARQVRSQPPDAEEILFDGFFHFNTREMELIDALRERCDLTVTLPEWEGAGESRTRLVEMGLVERRLERVRPRPEVVLLKARTEEQEVEEIAARVIESKRPFRETGIVVRTAEPYVPVIRAALERFGVPARFYFASPLAGHFLIRRWMSALASAGGRRAAAEWNEYCASLAVAVPPSAPIEPATHRAASLWRDRNAAARGWKAIAGETAELFDPAGGFSADAFRQRLEVAARLTTLDAEDRRRNVVHVMDAVEARQWELPVIHVCGLLEKQFPLYFAPDPVLPESLRRRLRQQGLRVQTAEDWDRQERFLFELATSRATERLVLSYPESNAKGDETLPSFYVERFVQDVSVNVQPARSVRPVPGGPKPAPRTPVIYDEPLRDAISRQHSNTGPTAIEEFLQCPFLFFARRTLKLGADSGGLDARLQGNIAHAVLARWIEDPQPVERLVNPIFRETCVREAIPDDYRAEAIRLELLRNLRRFVKEARRPEAAGSLTERTFTLALDDGVTLRCRIDRIDFTPDGRALIIDYKYSGPDYVKKLVKEHERGARVQGGIYMLAVRAAGYEVAGMLFAALKNQQEWKGWQADLEAVMEASRAAAAGAVFELRQGTILPRPADQEFCGHCDFRDICRVESAPAVLAMGDRVE